MSAIDNSEITKTTDDSKSDDTILSDVFKTSLSDRNSESYRIRKPKRILHFSDGTLEEFDDTDESDQENDGIEPSFKKSSVTENQTVSVNPKTLPWSSWIQHYTTTTGKKTLNVLDNIGENIAYYLGITTPKYQYEIDEYNRGKEEAMAKQKQKEMELKSWATTSTKSNNFEPIVTEVIHQPEKI